MPQLNIETTDNTLFLSINGRLDVKGSSAIWHKASEFILKQNDRTAKDDIHLGSMILNLEKVSYFDTAGAVFISHLNRLGKLKGYKQISIKGVKPEYSSLLKLSFDIDDVSLNGSLKSSLSFIEKKGKALGDFLSDIGIFITFLGEITWALLISAKQPGRIRWQDTLVVAERAGVDALPIVALISFIVGLVMAFQAAIPMKMFGAEIYVANLIGIAMVRELGPLMTAIVLSGRSASAFAAEIGTMKINEEIDALTIMGFDPVKFLIVPRVIASTVITPMLAVFANLMGILGGAVVILSFGYPIDAYYNQIVGFVTWGDFTGGIVKCFIFGILIAATGCIKGYQTKQGPSAVGEATTQAVVSSIVLIAVFDGIFSVVYYYLGI